MNRLLTANLNRMFRDRIFLFSTLAMLSFTIYAVVVRCINVDTLPPDSTFEDIYFTFAPSIGFFSAVLCAMFLGTEYSDGTIKNKIVMGHERKNIYLANLTTMFIGLILIMAIYLVVALIGIPILGFFTYGLANALTYIAIMVFVCLVYSALFTFISMNISNKALSLLVCLLVLFLISISAAYLDNNLKEPEVSRGIYEMSVDGRLVEQPAVPNPRYIDGNLRAVYQIALIILPIGQCLQVAWTEVANPWLLILFSVLTAITLMVLGAHCFIKKDIK